MTDDLVKRLRVPDPCCEEHHTQNEAADRIEALTEQLEAARADAKEAEAYAEELEKERDEALNQLDSARHSVDVLEGRVAMFMARLAKAVEALRLYACACDGGFCHANENFCGWTATAVLAEIKGGKKDE